MRLTELLTSLRQRSRRQRLVLGLSSDRVCLLLLQGWRRPIVVDQLELALNLPQAPFHLDGDAQQHLAQCVGHALQRCGWGNLSCDLVLSEPWIRWVSVPWVDTADGLQRGYDRWSALLAQQYVTLYGDAPTPELVRTHPGYAQAQLAAATPPGLLMRLSETLSSHGVSIRHGLSAHALSWNHWHRQHLKAVRHSHGANYLWASHDGCSLTLSWGCLPKRWEGVHTVAVPANAFEIRARIEREILAQRLAHAQVVLVLLDPSAESTLQVSAFPADWTLVSAAPGARITCAQALCHLTFPAHRTWRETSIGDVLVNVARNVSAHQAAHTPIHKWALVLIAVALAAYAALSNQLSQLQARYDEVTQTTQKQARQSQGSLRTPQASAGLTRAKEVVEDLNRPWDGMFAMIESSMPTELTLIDIAPSAHTGEIRISGLARQYDAILDFVDALNAQAYTGKTSNAAYLMSHQVMEQDPERKIRFDISAVWPTSAKVAP